MYKLKLKLKKFWRKKSLKHLFSMVSVSFKLQNQINYKINKIPLKRYSVKKIILHYFGKFH